MVWHAVHRLHEAGVDRVLLLCGPRSSARAQLITDDPALPGAVHTLIPPVGSGLRAAFAEALAAEPSVFLLHDPTRAFAPVAMIRRVIDAVRAGASVVVPVLPVVDTIRAVGRDGQASALVDRDRLRIVQTPQGFAPPVLRRRYGAAADDESAAAAADGGGSSGREFPDEAAALAARGEPLTMVPGHADAARVLTAGEIDQARRALGTAVIPPSPDRRIDARG